MTVFVGCSAKGSPGVTTSLVTMALTWPTDVVLTSLDPAGDDLRASILQASAPEACGVLELALSLRRGDADLPRHVVALSATQQAVWVLPGVSDPVQGEAIASLANDVLAAVTNAGRDVLIDAGRAAPIGLRRELVVRADVIVLVLRPTLPGVDRAKPVLSRLREQLEVSGSAARLGLLCVGNAPYPPDEVAAALDAPLIGVLPHDPGSVRALENGVVPWKRPLMRTASTLAAHIKSGITEPAALAVSR
jgi:hypothetical protein